MPRSRSRSPKRQDRRRSRSRERKHRHRRSRSRSPAPRYRSRSPVPRRRSRSHSPRRMSPSSAPRRRSPPRNNRRSRERDTARNSLGGDADTPIVIDKPQIDESKLEGLSEEDRDMMAVMGFAGFDTTKGKKVEGNDTYVANISRKRRYRQYMNRRGGFNRPLDFIA